MRYIGIIGLIIGGALALNVVIASASASLPLFSKLPSVKTFTGSEATTKFSFGESLGGLTLNILPKRHD